MYDIFGPPDLDRLIHHGLRMSDGSRESYLRFMVASHAATDAEIDEYREMVRMPALKAWSKHKDDIQRRLDEQEQAKQRTIAYWEEVTIILRKLGQFDMARKYEECIYLKTIDFQGSYRGFPEGWADSEIYNYERQQRELSKV